MGAKREGAGGVERTTKVILLGKHSTGDGVRSLAAERLAELTHETEAVIAMIGIAGDAPRITHFEF